MCPISSSITRPVAPASAANSLWSVYKRYRAEATVFKALYWIAGILLVFGIFRGSLGDVIEGLMFAAIPSLIDLRVGAISHRSTEEAAATPLRAITSPIQLGADESCLGSFQSRLITTQADSSTASTFRGIGFGMGPVMLGSGASQGAIQQATTLRPADAGHLVITTKRIVFVGGLQQIVLRYGDLLFTQVLRELVEVRESRDGAAPIIFWMPVRQAQLAASLIDRAALGEALMPG